MTTKDTEQGSGDSHLDIMRFLEAQGGGKAKVALRQDEAVPVLRPMEGRTEAGKYQLQGEIARGGVGVVLKGHDTQLGRDVALKVIREEYADDPEVLHRFVEEAQIGGQLQHPGVVPVYDLGLQDGRPFFAMKLVKGRTLAKLLEERVESRRGLIAIFEAVCQTMAYAHSRGVIHRDLKPANVMIGAFGEVHVVDWGMGKVLRAGGIEDERRALKAQTTIIATIRSEPGSVGSQSMIGSVMGTPAYMPPEQAMGDIERMDERSDVFSLGAILAEILTGQPPYLGTGMEVLQQAAHGALDACRERIAGCEADEDLKAIARQCLISAPLARPRDAGEVRARVSTYLAGLEEKARAAQVQAAEERIRVLEARRKHKLTLALASSVLLTVVVGGGGWWWVASRDAAREATLREQFQGLVLAAGRATDPEEVLAAVQRARDLLAQGGSGMPAPAIADLQRIEQEGKTAQERVRIASENAALLARVEELRGPGTEDERFQVDWADTDRQYGAAFAKCGLTPDQGTVEEAATALAARGEVGALASALDDWIFARREAKALEGAQRLAAVATQLDGNATRAKLRAGMLGGDTAALEELTASIDLTSTEPQTLRLLAESLRRMADPGVAYAFCLRAFEAKPGDFFLAHSLARSMHGAWAAGGDLTPADAVPYYMVAHSLRPSNYIASVEFAQQLINAGDFAAAEKLLRSLMAERPADAVLCAELGLVLGSLGQPVEAEVQFRKAIELDGRQAWCRQVFSHFLVNRGRGDAALEQAQAGVALAPNSGPVQLALASALLSVGRPAEALAAAELALELAPRDPAVRSLWIHALRLNGKVDEALAACRRMLAESPESVRVQHRGALHLRALGQTEEALGVLRAAVKMAQVARRPDVKLLASIHATIAGIQDAAGDTAGAAESYRQALAEDRTNAELHVEAAWHLQRHGSNLEAISLLERAVVFDPLHFFARWNLASCYQALNRTQDAIPHARRAIEIDPKHALVRGQLAELLLAVGQVEEGLTWARSAVQLEPKLVPTRVVLARALAESGQSAEALAELEATGVPLPGPLVALAGKLKAGLGRLDEGLADLQTAIWMSPEYFPAYEWLTGLLLGANRTEDALAVAERGVEVVPMLAASHLQLSLVLQRMGRVDQAQVSMQRSLAIEAPLASRLAAADLLALKGAPDEALQELRAIVAVAPQDASACTALAWALSTYPLKRRSAEEALGLAQRAFASSPATSHAALAAALFRAGKHVEAEAEFATVLATQDSGHACLAYLRAMNLHALGKAEEAQQWYAEAGQRMAKEGQYPWQDHKWLRDEAAGVFGVK